jgi:hypothetical protein
MYAETESSLEICLCYSYDTLGIKFTVCAGNDGKTGGYGFIPTVLYLKHLGIVG